MTSWWWAQPSTWGGVQCGPVIWSREMDWMALATLDDGSLCDRARFDEVARTLDVGPAALMRRIGVLTEAAGGWV